MAMDFKVPKIIPKSLSKIPKPIAETKEESKLPIALINTKDNKNTETKEIILSAWALDIKSDR